MVRQLPTTFYATIEGQLASTSSEHPALVAALGKHQVRKARTVMVEHIQGSADHLIANLERRGLWADERSS